MIEIKKRLKINKRTLVEFGLPEPNEQFSAYSAELLLELNYNIEKCKQEVEKNLLTINDEQKHFFDSVIDAIYNNSQQKYIFLDALGGTGKSFVASTILAYVRSKKHIAIAVAFSGIAALLLVGGRTLHSTFKLPIEFDNTTTW